jgi:hypothetical protein
MVAYFICTQEYLVSFIPIRNSLDSYFLQTVHTVYYLYYPVSDLPLRKYLDSDLLYNQEFSVLYLFL